MSINAMKLALEALENSKPSDAGGMLDAEAMNDLWHAHYAAKNALRTAIQQPATPEPVAWMLPRDGDDCAVFREPQDYPFAATGWAPLYTHPAPSAPDDVVRDAERYRWLMSWLQQMNLLKAEFGQMGKGEKPSDWWMLNAPYGIDKTRPFFGHGKTADAAIDAAMLAAKEASA